MLRVTDVHGPEKGVAVYKNVQEKYMEIPVESFHGRASDLSDVSNDSKGQRHYVWVVSVLLCTMRYISDPQYLPGDKESMETRSSKPKEISVQSKAGDLSFEVKLKEQQALRVVALRKSRVREELFVDYGIK